MIIALDMKSTPLSIFMQREIVRQVIEVNAYVHMIHALVFFDEDVVQSKPRKSQVFLDTIMI
jgi:hypothetical protein